MFSWTSVWLRLGLRLPAQQLEMVSLEELKFVFKRSIGIPLDFLGLNSTILSGYKG